MVAHSCLYSEIIVRIVFYKLLIHSFCWKNESKIQLITVHGGAGVRSVSCQRGIVGYEEGAPIRDFASMHRIKMVSLKCSFIGSWRIEPKLKTGSRTGRSTRLSSRQFALLAPHRTRSPVH